MSTPTLLLIHGLGSTSGVWSELLDILDWPAPIINAELAGHGLAAHQSDYTVGALAAGVSAQCSETDDVIAVGHSLGGCVALALASGAFRPDVAGVVGIGIKARWTDADVAGMAKVAAKGVRWFDTREEAVDRFLLQAGLAGVVDNTHPSIATGVGFGPDGKWSVTQDPNTWAQQAVDLAGLVAAATCPVILGAGENDAMVNESDLADAVPDPRIAAGRGHNVQVEDPAWVAGLINEVAGR